MDKYRKITRVSANVESAMKGMNVHQCDEDEKQCCHKV